ncbi:F-box and WD-40 domain protein 7 [Klebsormidium nitens]|uniref:F-box and WD-40 domain protein 7 n=1 Tax=Klebsormidium nitens TaxID=105231 RepID=A0A1Y1I2U3_KLENI|nr:F-box and WD-40 domain protein 7 [Klebsormidium nitens]|eukprot:GAQ85255.1 F-box and WD-40 domain protein 7 [Klebsormidium nitens]
MSRQPALRAADSHVQNEAYLARLGEAMAQLEMAWISEKPTAVAPCLDTPSSTQDRESKLRLLKGKLRRRSSGGEAASESGADSQADDSTGCKVREDPEPSKARLRSRSENVQDGLPSKTWLRSGLESGTATGREQNGSSSVVGQLARTDSGPRLVAETNRAPRRSGSEFDLNGRRVSGGATKSEQDLKPGLQPVPRDSSSHSTSHSGRNSVVKGPVISKQPDYQSFPAKKGARSGVSAGALEHGLEGTLAGDEPSTSHASLCPGPHSSCPGVSDDQRWNKGPMDEAGRVTKLSELPILCMSVLGNEAVVGSSDHAVYTVDLDTGRKKRTLYGKTAGHTEWVTCVTHLPDGRILSGGMDNRLLLWSSSSVTHCELPGHTASISAVQCSSDGSLAVSSSYDKTLRVWALPGADARGVGRGKGSGFKGTATCLVGHVAPVLDFAWTAGKVVSGARDGCVILWDIGAAASSRQLKRAHVGHVTALVWSDAGGSPQSEERTNLFLTGGQDGFLRAWDGRTDRAVAEVPVHVAASGTGAVSSIRVAADVIVTAGADGMVRVLDPRASFRVRNSLTGPGGFLYSLHVAGRTAFSGGGDGSVLVHDILDGRTLYGLGAINNGAVRCIDTGDSKLVCAGDDGTLITYCY